MPILERVEATNRRPPMNKVMARAFAWVLGLGVVLGL